MTIHRPLPTNSEHRVLKFRPRTGARPPASAPNEPAAPAPDLSLYGRGRDGPDDYRHRMITNVVAIMFTAGLTGIGIWLALTLADLRNTQDCVLMGRRDCGHISEQKIDPVRPN